MAGKRDAGMELGMLAVLLTHPALLGAPHAAQGGPLNMTSTAGKVLTYNYRCTQMGDSFIACN